MSMLVRHAMTADPCAGSPASTAADAARLMRELDVGVVPVVDDGRLIGLVTDRDLVVRVMAEGRDPERVRLADIATESIFSVSPDTNLSHARDLMADWQVRRLPVMKGDRLVGILSIGDVAEADASQRAVGETLAEISASRSTMNGPGGPDRGTPVRATGHRRGE